MSAVHASIRMMFFHNPDDGQTSNALNQISPLLDRITTSHIEVQERGIEEVHRGPREVLKRSIDHHFCHHIEVQERGIEEVHRGPREVLKRSIEVHQQVS